MSVKKTDPRLNDTRVTESSGNVFVDLGFDEADAKVMALRVESIMQLRESLRSTNEHCPALIAHPES